MPVYNGANYVATAIESILAQEFDDFELIISDNGSSDATPEICRAYQEQDDRIRLFLQEENLGATPNFDFVFQQARAPFFKWAAHDDVLLPGFIDQCMKTLEEDPSVVLACPAVGEIDKNGAFVKPYDYGLDVEGPDPHVRFYEYIAHPWAYHLFGIFRTEVLARTPRIESYAGSDNFLLAEVMLHGRMVELPDRLLHLRVHARQSTQAHPDAYERVRWFDADRKGGMTFPRWEGLVACVKGIARAPLSATDRMRCYGMLLRWATERWRVLGGEIKHNFERWRRSTGKKAPVAS